MKNRKTKPEILSPAGSMEALTAAVRAGADAVYLGASSFSARGNASNFDREQLKEAVEYCHMAGVDVHLAVNTVMSDSELYDAMLLVEYAATLPVDAVIVQDWGLYSIIKKCVKDLPVHCSTQMSIHTPAGARLMEALGAERVVLSRELSLSEIKEIRDAVSVEIEHFVHGALCMCVSGQCYMSAFLGGRSGNRGYCAQPCRLPFKAKGGTGYDLSLKDLSMITRLSELWEAGVDSFKIEGRMKRPEYVAAATRACRLAADNEPIPEALVDNLQAVFSRSGFTTGYPDGKLGKDMFGTRTYYDVTASTNDVLKNLRALYKDERQSVDIKMKLLVRIDQETELLVTDGDNTVRALGAVSETAEKAPLNTERVISQLKKTGGTVYSVTECETDIEENAALPISAINNLRREALEELSSLRKARVPYEFTKIDDTLSEHKSGKAKIRLRFSRLDDISDLPESAKSCEMITVPLFTKNHVLQGLLDGGYTVCVEVPRGMFGSEEHYRVRLKDVKSLGISHALAGNIGAAPLIKEAGMTMHLGFGFNVMNSYSLEFLRKLGAEDCELSPEITLKSAEKLKGELKRGAVLYGKMPLMLTRNCPSANSKNGCRDCENSGGKRISQIKDRKGVDFPVCCEPMGASQVYNSVPTVWSDKLSEAKNLDFITLMFLDESRQQIDDTIKAYQNNKKLTDNMTRGLYNKGVL